MISPNNNNNDNNNNNNNLKDLALYTLDALGISRCPPGTVDCTEGCMDLECAEKRNLSVFNGTPPEVVPHLADITRESIEEILLCTTSVDYNPSHQTSQMTQSQTMLNNDLSNGMIPRSYNSYSENDDVNQSNIKQRHSQQFSHTPKSHRRMVSLPNDNSVQLVSQSLSDAEQKSLDTGGMLLYSSHEEENALNTQGVALMLANKERDTLIGWKSHGPRNIKASFKIKKERIRMNVIQCYALTSNSNDDNIDPKDTSLRYQRKEI
ncbi:unnamed protein product [Schistosoma mattheei]|uniref:Uncharacterized protein n=1 Tax=Schistosoma mattheei TaxID=31246 RepID=A0A183PC35_9TREM|nr:unnamed protein product [Schistosoma mattheei]